MHAKPLLLVAAFAFGAFPFAVAGQPVARMHADQCEAGDLRSCTVLGLIYESGAAGVRDPGRAVGLYERACDLEVPAACARLGLLQAREPIPGIADGFHRTGHVADAGDGLPIAEAVVDLPELGLRVIADEAGRVDFGRLPQGMHDIVARSAGYETTAGELPVPWDADFLILMTGTGLDDERAPGRVFGRVTVDGSDIGLPDVAITVLGPSTVGAVTNQQGRFSLAGLDPGPIEIQFTRLGYETRTATVDVQPGRTVEVYAALSEQAIELEPIEVAVGSGYLDRTGFYRRARVARGDQFTRREVVEIDPAVVSDLLWRTPGVSIRAGARGTQILSRRPAVVSGAGTCRLRPYLDGVPMFDWDLDQVRPDDLQGLEVYQGAATPIEYRQNSDPDGRFACGVVLVWTRRN